MNDEEFVHGDKLFRRGLDGFWKCEDVIEVRKGKTRLKPIRGSRVLVVDDGFLLDIKKGNSDEEKIRRRVQRLEEMLPYEAAALRRAVKNEGVLEIGVFHGGRKEKVNVQQQPDVLVKDATDEVIRGILRNQYVTVGADGRLYQNLNVKKMVLDAIRKRLKEEKK